VNFSENGVVKKTTKVFLICFLVSYFMAVFLLVTEQFAWRCDFVNLMTGSRILRFGEAEHLYDLETQRDYQLSITSPNKLTFLPYRNLPIFAYIFIPLTFLPLLAAYKLYTVILIIVTLFISWFSSRVFKNLHKSYWIYLPFIFYPYFLAIFYGQVTIFLLLFFVLIYFFLRKESFFLVGFFVGFLFLKIQYIIVFPFIFFLVKDKQVYLKGLLVSSILIYLTSAYMLGFDFIVGYFKMLVITENANYGTKATSMFSLLPALSQISPFTKKSLFFINFAFYLLAIWYYYKNYLKYPLKINFSVIILFTLVFCVHGGIVDIALILLPIWFLIDIYRSKNKVSVGNIIVIFVLIFSYLLFILNMTYIIPFLFLFSVALLFRKINLGFLKK
jgi:hypothetical protein